MNLRCFFGLHGESYRDRDDLGGLIFRCVQCHRHRGSVITRTAVEKKLYAFSKPAHEQLKAKPSQPARVLPIVRAK